MYENKTYNELIPTLLDDGMNGGPRSPHLMLIDVIPGRMLVGGGAGGCTIGGFTEI